MSSRRLGWTSGDTWLRLATPADAVAQAAPVGPAGVVHGTATVPGSRGLGTARRVTVERASTRRCLAVMPFVGVRDSRSRRNQVPQRTVPTVSFASPFQSPTTARSVFFPNANEYVGAAPFFSAAGFCSRNQRVPRRTPTPSWPSPFQSPVTGVSVGRPNANRRQVEPADGKPRSSQTPRRTTPTSVRPSRLKSPTTGLSPAMPKSNSRLGTGAEPTIAS